MARQTSSITSKVIYSIVLAVLVYLGLSLWAGFGQLKMAAAQFKWGYFPFVLLLACTNYLIRFSKWQYYLKTLKLKVPRRESFIIFMSGLSLSITPGKLGEVIKSYFLKKRYNFPVATTAPIVFADRLTDLVSLVILASIGAIGFKHGQAVIWTAAGLVVILLLIIIIRPLGEGVITLLARWRPLARRVTELRELYDATYTLVRPAHLLLPVLISILAWGCEAVGFYLVFLGLGVAQGILPAIFIYSFSTIAGAVAMLPGGLGVTEGAITGLLRVLAVAPAVAALATVLIRVATLWFAVLLGTVFLVVAERTLGVTLTADELTS